MNLIDEMRGAVELATKDCHAIPISQAERWTEEVEKLELKNQRFREEAKRISRIKDHKTRHEQMNTLLAGVNDVSP